MITNGNIRGELGQMRADELVRDADKARLTRALRNRSSVATRDGIMIREAVTADAPALARLAELEGQPALTGRIVVGSVRGVIRAAVGADGRGQADPFVPTADLADLVRARARQIGAALGDCVGTARFSPRRLIDRAAVRSC